MKRLSFLTLIAWLAGSMLTVPAQAAAKEAGAAAPPLTFDLLCDSSPVCRIQNASLDSLNGQVIWLYRQSQPAADGTFSSLISLELPGGASRGFAVFGPEGGYLSLGMNDEGSLDHFQAEGTFTRVTQGSTQGRLMFHYQGEYQTN